MYSAILIDNIILEKNSKLFSHLQKVPESIKDFEIGTIFIIPKEIKDELSTLSLGKKRYEYINQDNFISSIKKYYYSFFNLKKNIFVLNSDCYEYIQEILVPIFSGIPPDCILWTFIQINDEDNFNNKLEKFISYGFENPYVTILTPMLTNIISSIALSKKNSSNQNVNMRMMIKKVLAVMKHYKKTNNSCNLYAKFSDTAIDFLQKTTISGNTIDNTGENIQKELSGELVIKDVANIDEKFVYVIEVDADTIKSGEKESVSVRGTRYNFHSHPHEAYIRHSVDKAWPSLTDYIGYLSIAKNTIFHCVSSLEGIYIISLSSYWCNKIKDIKEEFIKENYNIKQNKKYTPEEYVEKINLIHYKKHPIFHIIFFKWENAGSVFQVSFSSIDSTCLVTDQIVYNYRKIHS
jgi:hypothetical protein